jgi:hypothetical protein
MALAASAAASPLTSSVARALALVRVLAARPGGYTRFALSTAAALR